MTMAAPRVAPGYPFNTHPSSFEDPMFDDGLFHVLATGGVVSAGSRKKGGNSILIYQYGKYGNLFDYLSQLFRICIYKKNKGN
jgi:hypothetical protein